MEKKNKTDVLKQINNFFDEFNKLETEEEQTNFMKKRFPNVFPTINAEKPTNPLNV